MNISISYWSAPWKSGSFLVKLAFFFFPKWITSIDIFFFLAKLLSAIFFYAGATNAPHCTLVPPHACPVICMEDASLLRLSHNCTHKQRHINTNFFPLCAHDFSIHHISHLFPVHRGPGDVIETVKELEIVVFRPDRMFSFSDAGAGQIAQLHRAGLLQPGGSQVPGP